MEATIEKDLEVFINNSGEVTTTGALNVDVLENNDLTVSVNRKEFSIVGDDLYIPKRYEDAPQWLRDLISTVTEQSYTQKITELNNLRTSLQQLITELEVAKNTYTQSIISSNDIDERINTAITTLNSSLSNSDATIVDLISTKATPDEASAIALNTISSSINNGEIGALVGSVSSTLTTETEALANNIDLVHAEMLDGFESTADVIQTTQAYVGIDEAGASTGTGLSAYLEDSLGNVGGADSQVANGVYINNGVPTSKFEYTSDLSKNGVHYKSGFGLKTLATGGDGSAANPYDSEFWINAAKFKFTNDNVTGQVAPFTIDATGLTPQITFNGKVSFTNVTNVPVINKTYVQTTQPTSGMNTGDTWIDTDDNNSLYTYNGTSWVKTQSGAKTYLQATAPTSGMIVGDIWVDSDDNYKQYRYNGSSWVALAYNPATAINTGTTTINGGKITTGSITAAQIQANSISADKLLAGTNSTTVWAGGGLVSANFNGNPYGSIGTPTQGFRLSANATGTSSDPNIYGAYIKGATLEGAYIKGATLEGTSLTINDVKVRTDRYPNNYGPIFITKNNTITGSNGYTSVFTIVGQGYSSGYHNTRICSNSVPINLIASSYGSEMPLYTWILSVRIEVSYDNVNWTSIASSARTASGVSASILYTPTANFNTLYIRSYHAHNEGGSYMSSGILQISLVNGQ